MPSLRSVEINNSDGLKTLGLRNRNKNRELAKFEILGNYQNLKEKKKHTYEEMFLVRIFLTDNTNGLSGVMLERLFKCLVGVALKSFANVERQTVIRTSLQNVILIGPPRTIVLLTNLLFET